jgi:ATP-binding cassette subfamily F protein uup
MASHARPLKLDRVSLYREGRSAPGDSKPAPRKLSYKEQRELEGMEPAILAAEAEVVRLEKLLADPDYFVSHAAEWPQMENDLRVARDRVAQLYERWAELGAVAIQSQA